MQRPIQRPIYRAIASGLLTRPGFAYASIVGDTGELASFVTFTRSSTGSRFNSAGLLESVAANAPRYDYDPASVTRANLLTYSENLTQASWTKNNITITQNAIEAPDGTMTADLMASTSTSNPNVYANTGYLGSEGTYTFSVYLRAGTVNEAAIQMFVNGGAPTGNVIHSAISVLSGPGAVSGAGGTIITVTGLSTSQWSRIAITGISTATAGALAAYIKTRQTGMAIGDSIYIWGAQLERASSASAYIATGAAPAGNATLRGLLIEEQRTNLAQHSAAFDAAAWLTGLFGNHVKPTVTANTSTGPDGSLAMDRLTSTHASASTIGSSISAATPSQAYTMSVWIRAGTATQAAIGLAWGLAGVYVSENITTVNLTSEFQRFTFTATCPASGVDQVQLTISLGNRVSGGGIGTTMEVWGAQLEAGAFATSYIPTTTASVTRAADNASVNTLSNIGFNTAEGTFVAVADWYSFAGGRVLSASGSGFASRLADVYGVAPGNIVYYKTTDATQNTIGTGMAANTPVRIALAYKADDYNGAINGVLGGTDTATSGLATVDAIGIGSWNSTAHLNGHIRRLRYYPKRLSNAQLQALTA